MNKIVKIIFKCIEVFEQKKNNKKLQIKCDSRNTNKKNGNFSKPTEYC